MIYTDEQLIDKIKGMIEKFEDEVVEFKEARTNYSFKDIGKYFSALGNEANIRGKKEAWLVLESIIIKILWVLPTEKMVACKI